MGDENRNDRMLRVVRILKFGWFLMFSHFSAVIGPVLVSSVPKYTQNARAFF